MHIYTEYYPILFICFSDMWPCSGMNVSINVHHNINDECFKCSLLNVILENVPPARWSALILMCCLPLLKYFERSLLCICFYLLSKICYKFCLSFDFQIEIYSRMVDNTMRRLIDHSLPPIRHCTELILYKIYFIYRFVCLVKF